MSELKPCPFCGDANVGLHPPTCDRGAEYDPLDRAFPIIRCGGCYAEAHGDNWDHRGQSVIASWNRRAAPVVSEEMVERAAMAVERAGTAAGYGWTDEQFEIWWNRDPEFCERVHTWFSFQGTRKQKLFWETRTAITAALGDGDG